MNGCFFLVNVGKYTIPMDPVGYTVWLIVIFTMAYYYPHITG